MNNSPPSKPKESKNSAHIVEQFDMDEINHEVKEKPNVEMINISFDSDDEGDNHAHLGTEEVVPLFFYSAFRFKFNTKSLPRDCFNVQAQRCWLSKCVSYFWLLAPLLQEESDDVNFKEDLACVLLPSERQCFPLIERIRPFGKDLFDDGLKLDGSKDICSPNNDEVEFAHRGNAPSLVTHPQCPLRAQQERYTRMLLGVFVQAIVNKVSYTSFDGLPSLRGDFNSHYAIILQKGIDVAVNEHLLQEVEREVINLHGQIDIINANEVMDAATKASLKKTNAFIKESFEDLKNFKQSP
ncbi:hypothetical protein Cgig2_017256 [Carnegiea gigantea]|uniref:Uncharacterized protein n=1 Tax=Carnegiea gigantea TaxID=171969 RepID=A0A9Q1GPF9_9CARY|nr:hypothetical protein Cgig2_017256 [Carnegiea gigantea]